jgi:hypothetical protein
MGIMKFSTNFFWFEYSTAYASLLSLEMMKNTFSKNSCFYNFKILFFFEKKYFSSFLSLSWVVFHNFFFKTYLLVKLNLNICLVLDYIVKQEKYFFDDFIFRWNFFFSTFFQKKLLYQL